MRMFHLVGMLAVALSYRIPRTRLCSCTRYTSTRFKLYENDERTNTEDTSDAPSYISLLANITATPSRWWENINKKVSIPTLVAGSVLGIVISISALGSIVTLGLESGGEESGGSVSSEVLSSATSIIKPVTLFEDILIDLKQGYVEDISTNKLFKTAMGAMLKSLDPYTEFEDLSAAASLRESVSGKYGGVGMVIAGKKTADVTSIAEPSPTNTNSKDDTKGKKLGGGGRGSGAAAVTVVDAFEGYSYDADVRVGDRIVTVNGVDTRGLDVEKVRSLLRGEPGTDVTIELERDDFTPSSINVVEGAGSASTSSKKFLTRVLKRDEVRLSDVRLATFLGDPHDAIGYISLSGFNGGSSHDFGLAMLMLRYGAYLDALQSSNPPDHPFTMIPNANQGTRGDLKGLIVDLRGNPGGLLEAAVEIASYLVPPDSVIVSAKGKDGVETVYHSPARPLRPSGMKLAILVNGGSASASEVLSGAVQDLDSGIVVGPTRTFGKGLVQKIVELPYESALKYTIAKYYTPSGRCIQAIDYKGGRASLASVSSAKESSVVQPDVNDELDGNDLVEREEEDGIDDEEDDSDASPFKAFSKQRKIPENERRTFTTVLGRYVKDGGGIEPDVKVPPLRNSPIEDVLYANNVFDEFSSDYIKKHDIRSYFRAIALSERLERENDPRFQERGFAYDQFIVFPSTLRVDAKAVADDTKIANKDKKGGVSVTQASMVAIEGSQAVPKDQQTNEEAPAVSSGSASKQERFAYAVASATTPIPPSPTDISGIGENIPSALVKLMENLNIRPGSLSSYFFPPSSHMESGTVNKQIAIAPSDSERLHAGAESPTTASTFRAPNSRLSYESLGLPLVDWEQSLLSAYSYSSTSSSSRPSSLSSTVVSHTSAASSPSRVSRTASSRNEPFASPQRREQLYRDFKAFVETKVRRGDLDIVKTTGLDKDISKLEARIRRGGEALSGVADEVAGIKEKISKNAIADMDVHKLSIIDGLENSLFSRELPDRLLLYRAILNDPQVDVARKLLAASSSDVGTAGRAKTNTATVVSYSAAPDGSSSSVASSHLPTSAAAIDAPSPRTVDATTLKDFTGVYERLLNPGDDITK